VLTRDNWAHLVDVVRERAGTDVPMWKCLAGYYSVCIPSVVDTFAAYAWQLYALSGYLRNETVASISQLPTRLVEAFQVFRTEIDRIERIRKRAQENRDKNRSKNRRLPNGRRQV